MSKVRTQQTGIWRKVLTGAVYTLEKIPSVTAIPLPAPSATDIDVSTLDSLAAEKLTGLVDYGSFEIGLIHVSFPSAEATAYEAFMAQSPGDQAIYVVGFADGPATAGVQTAPPTIDAATGIITYPTTRTFREFLGNFGGAGDSFAQNDAVKASAKITVSGVITRKPRSTGTH